MSLLLFSQLLTKVEKHFHLSLPTQLTAYIQTGEKEATDRQPFTQQTKQPALKTCSAFAPELTATLLHLMQQLNRNPGEEQHWCRCKTTTVFVRTKLGQQNNSDK